MRYAPRVVIRALEGATCFTIHSVHFYERRISLLPVTCDRGLIVRYLDIDGRVLLKNGINVVEELRANFDCNGR